MASAKKANIHLQIFLNDYYIAHESATSLLRHTLAGLWLAIHFTVNEYERDIDTKYELTKVLFRQKSMVSCFLSARILSVKSVLQGLQKFVLKYEELFDSYFETRMRMSVSLINRLGETKLITAMDTEIFSKSKKK